MTGSIMWVLGSYKRWKWTEESEQILHENNGERLKDFKHDEIFVLERLLWQQLEGLEVSATESVEVLGSFYNIPNISGSVDREDKMDICDG